jgi:hypothetical protein
MRSILGFVLAQGIAVLVTWAGLHYDNALAYVGVTLIVLVAILWIWSWSTQTKPLPTQAPVRYDESNASPDSSEGDKALFSLKRARDNARVALHNRSDEQSHRAFHELQAALVTSKKAFGIGPLTLKGEGSFRDFLPVYVAYIDSFYPHLREGHLDLAKRSASGFTWRS